MEALFSSAVRATPSGQIFIKKLLGDWGMVKEYRITFLRGHWYLWRFWHDLKSMYLAYFPARRVFRHAGIDVSWKAAGVSSYSLNETALGTGKPYPLEKRSSAGVPEIRTPSAPLTARVKRMPSIAFSLLGTVIVASKIAVTGHPIQILR